MIATTVVLVLLLVVPPDVAAPGDTTLILPLGRAGALELDLWSEPRGVLAVLSHHHTATGPHRFLAALFLPVWGLPLALAMPLLPLTVASLSVAPRSRHHGSKP
jgi:hypothetical protein